MLQLKILFACIILSISAPAQVSFKALLLNKNDSIPMAFANVKLIETDKYVATDEKGRFEFTLPQQLQTLHFEIFAIGCHTTIAYQPVYANVEKIYAPQLATTMKEIEIRGFTAKTVMKKAVAAIPSNYSNSSYADYSFLRQYQKVNGHFKNLIEAQLVVMFNLSRSGNAVHAKEAFAVAQIRRSPFKYDMDDFYTDECSGLFKENPIYHLAESALNPKAFDDYVFSFDTLNLPDAYVVDYSCAAYSSENHGIDNYAQLDFSGESREYGKLVIDKESFAIMRYERRAIRNKRYNYPKNNNFILPSMKYTGEFLEGDLLLEYKPFHGKWYLTKMLYDYSNEYYRTQTYQKEFTITDVYEWYSDSITRLIPKELLSKFYFEPHISTVKYTYDPAQWRKTLPPFYWYKKEDVFKDLYKEPDGKTMEEEKYRKEGEK